jgi:hypothetical protein
MSDFNRNKSKNTRKFMEYCTNSTRAMNSRSWDEARNNLNKALQLLPSFGVDVDKGVVCSSPFNYVFNSSSDLEYLIGMNAEVNGLQEKAIEHYKSSLRFLQRLIP